MGNITISRDRFNEVMERMCDDFCIYPEISVSQESLEFHCNECPLNNIECEDYWEGRDDG